MANPIRKLVQLVLDKNSAQKMEGDAKKSLGAVDKGLASLKRAAISLGSALAAAFAVRKIVAFGKETVRVAAEADAIWTRLGQAVENVGVSFDRARPEIERFARAVQDVTTVGDEDFAQVLTELITTTGDYRKSLENIGVVLDLAAAKQLDLRTAAQLVGRAMVGQTSTLTRYGIVVREGEDAVEVLRRTFKGFAENEARSLQGQMSQLNNEWSDFKQAIGEAITAGAQGESILDRLTASVKALTGAVQEYVNAAAGLPETFLDERETIQGVVTASETAEDAIRRLQRLRELEVRRLQMAEEELGKQPGFLSVVMTGRSYWKWRAQVEDAKDQVEGYRIAIANLDRTIQGLRSGDIQPGALVGNIPPPPDTGGGGEEDPADQQAAMGLELRENLQLWKDLGPAAGRFLELQSQIDDQTEKMAAGWERLNQQMEMSPKNAAKLAGEMENVGDMAGVGQSEIQLMGAAADAAGTLIAGAFGGNVGQLARWKAEQNAVMAAEQLAMAAASALIPGLQGQAAGHVAAAGLFSAVAASWAALAGATGGFSGGGGGSSAPRDTGGAASESAAQMGSEVHLYLVGSGWNAINPEVQRVVYGAMREAEQRYGPNANVKIHRSGG